MDKKEIRVEFWLSMLVGFVIVTVVVGALFLGWAGAHSDRTNQTMIQAIYLAELSGYENDLAPKDSQIQVARQLATETRAIPTTRLNPELVFVASYQGADIKEPGSYVIQLHKSHAEAINRTLEGSMEPAEELCALYRATVGLRWLPHGTTLLIIYYLGLLIVVIVCSERILSLAWRFGERLEECNEKLSLVLGDELDDEPEDESGDKSKSDESEQESES